MKGKKNLERAIVLGLILSTGLYSTAWAKLSNQLWINTDAETGSEFKLDYSNRNWEINNREEVDQKHFDAGVLVTSTNPNTGINYDFTFAWNLNSLNINITKLAEGSVMPNNNYYIAGIMTDGFDDEKTANLILTTNEGIYIKVNSENNFAAVGVWAQSDDSISLNSKNKNVTVIVKKTDGSNLSYINGSNEEDRTLHAVYGLNTSNDRDAASYDPDDASYGSEIKITTDNGSISVTAKNESEALTNSHVYAAANDNGHLILSAGQGADYDGTGSISLSAESKGNNNVYGLDTWGGEENRLTADKIFISAEAKSGNAYGVKVSGGANENNFNADYNEIKGVSESGNAYGIWADGDSRVDVTGKDNFISGIVTGNQKNGTGIMVDGSVVSIEGNNNYINADVDTGGNEVYLGNAKGLAIDAKNASWVVVKGNVSNTFGGAVYANGTGTNILVEGKGNNNSVVNNFYSAAVIDDAGDIDTESNEDTNKFYGKKFVSALYAEDGAHIDVTGENYIGTYADSGNDKMLERTVWAYSADDTVGSSINITGASIIGTDRYSTSPNSADVAIAAGTATDLSKSDVKNFVNEEKNGNAERSTVTFKYDNFDSGKSSSINGDILAAYAGLVDISTDNSEAGINITGNLLAGNNGILSVDLGKGGVLTGRADDYGNAGYVDDGRVGSDLNGEQKTFYDPAFSSTIFSGGNVGLKMGAGSRWNVTGQSWITSIDTSNANGETQNERATIDLVNYYKDETGKNNTNAHALTVYDFNGDADFIMNLDGNRANSDMLYMKKANGTYRINLIDVVTTDEINSDHNGKSFSGLRFATVGKEDSDVTFLVGSYDNGGAFNVEYEVGTDEYGGTETADENTVYNGGSINSGKPGDSMVDGLFGNNDAPVGSEPENENDASSMNLVAANNIMLMSEEAATLDETVDAANDATDYKATNYKATNYKAINHKIIARLGEEISDTGKTILNMSRANYSNAIYMDRLNKRLGEARYINSEEDEGMWVRIRHDRIGKEAAYRSQNTMYELGYDQKQECDNGERRVGMAIDYMHGDTGYDQIAGKGEIDRYGLWLYDTWMGDKGHYADYVAKWGHLSNDFEVYTMNDKTKQVTGDYSNNVFSVSAEYGRKKDIGNDWYFEPQVQAQLARVTGADYTTNQGTKVSVDGINSLIGRAGFRLGKDFGEEKQSTVYIKADVLHEFLGDQDVRVLDKSSDNKWAGISYENEGTWYDVGFGFATQMSKNSYAFMDFEKSFGNDNDETYQINVGMQWSF